LASRGQLSELGSSSPTTLTAYTRDGQAAVTKRPNTDTTTTAYDLADEALSTTLLSNGTTTTEGTYGYVPAMSSSYQRLAVRPLTC